MRPNLSLESFAGALAVLGTGVIMAACGGDKPAVNANEVSNASAPADGAGHCGAGKDHKPGEANCSADKAGAAKTADPTAAKPADTTPAAATPAAATPAAATPDAKSATPAAATPDPKAATPTPATTGTAKKPGAPATPPKKGGSGSCGAGTCGAKK